MYIVYLLSEDPFLADKLRTMPGRVYFKSILCPEELPKARRGVVIAHNIPENSSGKIPSGYLGVAMEGDKAALELFKKSGVKVVTCGFSKTATVTLSAASEDSAAISIQRGIASLAGEGIEEGDIPLKFCPGYDELVSMLWAAAALLSLGPEKFPAFV